MYSSEHLEGQIDKYVEFFDKNWDLLEQALLELGSDPDNKKVQARIRSMLTVLQLTMVTIDHLQDQRGQIDSSTAVFPARHQGTPAAVEAIAAA